MSEHEHQAEATDCGRIEWRGGRAEITLRGPTSLGTTQLTLTPGVLDTAAVEYFARRYCHWLAATIHSARGWPLIVVERRRPSGMWIPLHTAVRAPCGRIFDITGLRTDAELWARYDDCDRPLRVVTTSRDELGDRLVNTGIVVPDEGGPGWWSLTTSDRPHALVAVFADALLRRHGFGGLLDHPARGSRAE